MMPKTPEYNPPARCRQKIMDTLRTIKELAAKQFGGEPEAIDENAPVDKLGIDSLGFLEFMFELEDKFGFRFRRRRRRRANVARACDGDRWSDRRGEKATAPSVRASASRRRYGAGGRCARWATVTNSSRIS